MSKHFEVDEWTRETDSRNHEGLVGATFEKNALQ